MRGSNINNDIWCSSRGRRTLDCVYLARPFPWCMWLSGVCLCELATAAVRQLPRTTWTIGCMLTSSTHDDDATYFPISIRPLSAHQQENHQLPENGKLCRPFSAPKRNACTNYFITHSILWWKRRCFFYNTSQSIDRTRMDAYQFVVRGVCARGFPLPIFVFNLMLRPKTANITQTDERQRERDMNRRD